MQRFTMATADQKRSIALSLVELEILMHTHGKYEHIFRKRQKKVTRLQWQRRGNWLRSKLMLKSMQKFECSLFILYLITFTILQLKIGGFLLNLKFIKYMYNRLKKNSTAVGRHLEMTEHLVRVSKSPPDVAEATC